MSSIITITSESTLANLPQFVGAKDFVVIVGTSGSGTPWAWYEETVRDAVRAKALINAFIAKEEEYRIWNPEARYAWRVVVEF